MLAWKRREYSFDAINMAFEGMLGWHGYLMGGMWYWRKPNGANADAKDVRKALKATFRRRADPEATYGPESNRQVVAVSL